MQTTTDRITKLTDQKRKERCHSYLISVLIMARCMRLTLAELLKSEELLPDMQKSLAVLMQHVKSYDMKIRAKMPETIQADLHNQLRKEKMYSIMSISSYLFELSNERADGSETLLSELELLSQQMRKINSTVDVDKLILLIRVITRLIGKEVKGEDSGLVRHGDALLIDTSIFKTEQHA